MAVLMVLSPTVASSSSTVIELHVQTLALE